MKINVVDTIAPVVSLIGAATVTVELGDTYTELGAIANDATGTVTAVSDGQINTLEGCTSISDTNGNLLFYLIKNSLFFQTNPHPNPSIFQRQIHFSLNLEGYYKLSLLLQLK